VNLLDKDTKLHFVVSQFNDLENILGDCLSFIPFIENNKEVVSPRFPPIIIESCGLIESIFKEYLLESDDGQTFKEYSKNIEPHLVLEEAISLFLNQTILFLNPFEDWTNDHPFGGKPITSSSTTE
jgi:hypothetical protein